MKKQIVKTKMDNLIRISESKKIGSYCEAILMRMRPSFYRQHGCIKLRFTKNVKKDVYYLCNLFWNAGLVVKNVEEDSEGFRMGDDTILDDKAYVITLNKIGAVDFKDDEDYEDWVKKEWEKII